MRKAAEDYGMDEDRLYVSGHSAGGHLTAMMLAALWPVIDASLPRNLYKGGLAVSGVYDLRPLVDIDWLKEAYRRTRKDGAVGVDGVTAEEYEQDLEGNLQRLLDREAKP